MDGLTNKSEDKMKNKPAFPAVVDGPTKSHLQEGMNLFQYIAIKAMPVELDRAINSGKPYTFETLAKRSCNMAEAMIKELESRNY